MSSSDRRPPFYLGIDLGGTNIKSGVVDDDGRPFAACSVPTNAERGPAAGLDSLAEAGRQAVAASGLSWDEIAGVGLGSPGTMDLRAGMLLEPPNLPGWDQMPIRRLLGERLGKPTILQNDGNAAAFGESWAGAGRGTASLVMFTLGTGIGGGIIEQGRAIEGRHSHGAELGHIIIQMENARQCSCGGFGHLEGYASATAVVKRALEALERGEVSSLRRCLAERDLTARSIHEASEAGDRLARRLMRETARYLAIGAVNLMHTINPELILFGGGMIAAGDSLLGAIRDDVRSMAFPAPAAGTRVEFAKLGGDAGFIGAAGCARQAFGSGPVPLYLAQGGGGEHS